MDFNSFLRSLPGSNTLTPSGQEAFDSAEPSLDESLVPRTSSTSLEQKLAGGASKVASDALAAAAERITAPKAGEAVPRGRALEATSSHLRVSLDAEQGSLPKPGLSQLEGTTITHYVTEPSEELPKLISVNNSYISYGLQKGQVRVLHRQTGTRALLKNHELQLTDLSFLNDETDDLASASSAGTVVVWRLAFDGGEVIAETLLSLRVLHNASEPARGIRLSWHHHWARMLVIAASTQVLACVIGVSEIGAAFEASNPPHGVAALPFESNAGVAAVSFSPDGKQLAAGRTDGKVEVASIATLAEIEVTADASAGPNVSSITWISNSSLLIGSNGNVELQIWRLGSGASLQHQQAISFQSAHPLLYTLAFDHNHGLVLLSNVKGNTIASLQLSAGRDSCIAFAQFQVTMPIISMEALSNLEGGSESDASIQVFCVQTQAIQQYSLQPAQCLPAEPAASADTAIATTSTPPVADDPTAVSSSPPINQELILEEQKEPSSETSIAEPRQAPPSAGVVPVAVPPPQHVHPPLLTPSQLMLAAKSSLPRSVSGNSSVVESEAQARQLPTSTAFSTHATIGLHGRDPYPVPQSQERLQPLPGVDAVATENSTPAANPETLPAEETGPQTSLADAVSLNGASAPPADNLLTGNRPSTRGFNVAPSFLPPHDNKTGTGGLEKQEGGNVTSLGDLYSRLQRDQKRLLHTISQNHQGTLRALKEETRKESKRLEAAVEAQVSKFLKAQNKTITEERKLLLAEARQNLEKLLVAISSSINRDLPQRIEETLKREVSAITRQLKPSLQTAITESLPKELASTAMQTSLEKALAAQLKTSLAKPLQDSFRSSFQQHVLPAFEGACQSMFSQVQATFAGGLAEHLQAAGGANSAMVSSLQDSIGQATALAARLSDDISKGCQQLVELANKVGERPQALGGLESPVDHKPELKSLVEAKRYEEAFNKALDLGDVNLVAWLCSTIDPLTLLGTTPSPLGQHILLVLLQQLGYDLSKDTSIKVQWIKEIGVELDPQDSILAPHMRTVLESVLANLQNFNFEAKDAKMARISIAVLESTLKSCKV